MLLSVRCTLTLPGRGLCSSSAAAAASVPGLSPACSPRDTSADARLDRGHRSDAHRGGGHPLQE